MEKKFSHPEKVSVNLKHIPPIDPVQIMSSSFSSLSSSAFDSKGNFNKSNPRRTSVFKVLKASPNQGIKGVELDEAVGESSNSAGTMKASNVKKVEEASSTLTCKKKGKKKKAFGNKISLPTLSRSLHRDAVIICKTS